MAPCDDHVNTRAYLKGQLTATEKCFSKFLPENISKTNLDKLCKKVRTLNPKIDSNYESLLLCLHEEDHAEIHNQYQEMRERLEVLEDFLSTAEEKFREENERIERERDEERRKTDEMLQRDKLELEAKIEKKRIEQQTLLDKERIANWLSFRDRFNQAVHNRTDISRAEKLGHLISNLEGKALEIVKSFGIEDANYQVAYDLLQDMFEHKRQIAFKLVDNILDHPSMQSRSSDALLKAANVLTNSMAAIKSLDDSVDVADLLL
ncbi:unnamed protein product, partial [Allacma fusca]